MEAVNQAITINPMFKTEDENLTMKTSQELKAELQKGLEVTVEDFNPLKVVRERK
jgi:hypothetical protein